MSQTKHSITDLDVTGLVEKRSGNILGDAHEHFVVAILMRLGFEVSITELSAEPYDCIVFAFDKPPSEGGEKFALTTQVKTCTNSISLTGGTRAGVDRIYDAEETEDKSYKYTPDIVDLLIGVDKENIDLYLLPAFFTTDWGKSKSLNKIEPLKNNWDVLINWNTEFLEDLKYDLPDFER